jgi:uncharacterized protein (TIGR00730 family)
MASATELIITVFGSGRSAPASKDYETARVLGAALARAGFAVVTGAYGGTMEGVSRGASEAGGRVLGVTCAEFPNPANQWVEEEIRVKTWANRLFKLVELGVGYVVLPGGTGTLVELAVVWERMSKGFMPEKPFIILSDTWQQVIDAIPPSEFSLQPMQRARTTEEAVSFLVQGLDKSSSGDN